MIVFILSSLARLKYACCLSPEKPVITGSTRLLDRYVVTVLIRYLTKMVSYHPQRDGMPVWYHQGIYWAKSLQDLQKNLSGYQFYFSSITMYLLIFQMVFYFLSLPVSAYPINLNGQYSLSPAQDDIIIIKELELKLHSVLRVSLGISFRTCTLSSYLIYNT